MTNTTAYSDVAFMSMKVLCKIATIFVITITSSKLLCQNKLECLGQDKLFNLLSLKLGQRQTF